MHCILKETYFAFALFTFPLVCCFGSCARKKFLKVKEKAEVGTRGSSPLPQKNTAPETPH